MPTLPGRRLRITRRTRAHATRNKDTAMAGLLDFFNTSTDEDLYGGLLSPQQRSGLAGRSLAAMAEKFGQLAMPQRAPIPLGAILGQGFGAYGAGNDEAVKTLFEAQYKGAQAKKLQSEIEFAKSLGASLPDLQAAFQRLSGAPGAAATSGSGTSGYLAAPASAGGGGSGGWGPHADTVISELKAQGFSDAAIQGIMANGLGEGGFKTPWNAGDGG